MLVYDSSSHVSSWSHSFSVKRQSNCHGDSCEFKQLSLEIFMVFSLKKLSHLGLNRNRFSFFSFKEIPSILDSQFKYWCVSYQSFSDWQLSPWFSNFLFFWDSSPLSDAAKGVNTSRRFVESPRMIDNYFRSSQRIFFNTISVSLFIGKSRIQLSILLGDSTNLWEGLV